MMTSQCSIKVMLGISISLLFFNPMSVQAQVAHDPGPRSDSAVSNPPPPLSGLTSNQVALFKSGAEEFAQKDKVADGLGPTMNLDSCGGCHAQPVLGGSSPDKNPQYRFWNDYLK